MIGKIPSENELFSLNADFKIFDILATSPTPIYSFQEDSLETLKTFAKNLGISVLFIERTYIDKKCLKISDELFKGIKLDILGGVQFDSHRFNRDLESMDLSTPVELRIFALYEGKPFGVHYIDPDLDGLRRITPEMRVSGFIEERMAKLKEKTVIEAKKDDPAIERFCDVLLLDRMYRAQRNDDERMNYVIKIARRPGNDNLKKVVMKEDGSGFSTERIRSVVALTVRKMDSSKDTSVQMVFKKE